MIPHAVLPMPPQRMAALYSGRMSGSEGVGGLLAQFLLQVTGHPEQYHAADANRLGAVGLDLATTMLGRHLVAEDEVPTEVRRRALVAQVQAYVHRHLGDTTLSPQCLADAHHLSVRSLHRLFEAEDTTVASYIRELRLSRCWRDLSDPALRYQSVHTIAARWGFPTGPTSVGRSRGLRAEPAGTPQRQLASGTDRQSSGVQGQFVAGRLTSTRRPDARLAGPRLAANGGRGGRPPRVRRAAARWTAHA
ncbi:helix-turn-helix domain-containing protein [Micromonospora sp. M12]